MGQSSIPVLNRTGYSMFWSSVWDDSHLYKRLFKEDVLIRKYILSIFNDKISSKPIFLTKKYEQIMLSKSILNKHNIKSFPDMSLNSFSKHLFKLNKLPNYISKVHIVRYQKWLVVYFCVFTPTSTKNLSTKKKLTNVFKFFNKYCYSFIKHKYLTQESPKKDYVF